MLALIAALSFVQHINVTDLANLNLYTVFGLPDRAPARDVKRAYKRFVVQKNRNQSPSDRTLRTWRQTETAYDILSDPSTKTLYDQFGIHFVNETGFSVFGYRSNHDLAIIAQMYKGIPQGFENFGGFITFPIQFGLLDFLKGAEKTVTSLQKTACICPRGGTKCAKCRQSQWMTRFVQFKVALPPGASEFH